MQKFGSISILLLAFILGCGSKPDIPDGTLVSVLYTSDTKGKIEGCGCKHNGGGITKRSSKIKASRTSDPTVIYCDAGNFLTGSNSQVDSTKGELIVSAYNEMNANVVNISEREFTLGVDAFKEAQKKSKFDYVSSNITIKGSKAANPYVIKKVKEARVAFIGVCGSKDVMRIDSAKIPAGVEISNPFDAVRKAVSDVKSKSDLIVVLSTCGDGMDSSLASNIPDIDVIVGGRSFRPNPDSPWIIGKTRVVRAAMEGKTMGRMDMVFGPDRKLKTWSPQVINMETSDPSDGAMLSLVQKFIPSFIDNPTDGVKIASN